MEFQIFIQNVLITLIAAVVPVITAMLVAWLQLQLKNLRAKLSSEQNAQLDWMVAVAVKAAEQSGLTKAIENDAATKRDYAISLVQNALESRNITHINVMEIEAAIEAAINKGLQKPETTKPTQQVNIANANVVTKESA